MYLTVSLDRQADKHIHVGKLIDGQIYIGLIQLINLEIGVNYLHKQTIPFASYNSSYPPRDFLQ